jgi:hypothetical protein
MRLDASAGRRCVCFGLGGMTPAFTDRWQRRKREDGVRLWLPFEARRTRCACTLGGGEVTRWQRQSRCGNVGIRWRKAKRGSSTRARGEKKGGRHVGPVGI